MYDECMTSICNAAHIYENQRQPSPVEKECMKGITQAADEYFYKRGWFEIQQSQLASELAYINAAFLAGFVAAPIEPPLSRWWNRFWW